jgi:hypothetical protein
MMAVVPPPYAGYLAPPRVPNHLQTLAILWYALGAFRLITGFIAALAFHSFAHSGWFLFNELSAFPPSLLGSLASVIAISSFVWGTASLFVGWSLQARKPWARGAAIFMAILTLFKFPVGTAVGIYTLWVLAPARSGVEWQQIQQP